jgi:hypothetical protein
MEDNKMIITISEPNPLDGCKDIKVDMDELREKPMKTEAKLKKYWISWYHDENFSPFELETAWWISGEEYNKNRKMICAAIYSDHIALAHQKIQMLYDIPPREIEFRFCEEKPNDWTPYCDRFPKADWMTFE